MQITRREFCESAAAVALAAAFLGDSAFNGFARMTYAQTPSAAELLQPTGLPDMALGAENAPITIIEYASMSCGACAHFAVTTFPELKKRHIDTGKVRYILREFPLDRLAAAGSMLARCSANGDKDKFYAMIDTLFHKQNDWVVQDPIPKLLAIAKQAGFSEQSFKECLTNQKLLDDIEAVRQRGNEKFGISSTPTFFINGQKHGGDLSIEAIEKIIQPYLKGG